VPAGKYQRRGVPSATWKTVFVRRAIPSEGTSFYINIYILLGFKVYFACSYDTLGRSVVYYSKTKAGKKV
jgi:hypothetical protein